MNKNLGYIVWTWGTTVLMGGVIIALALTPNFSSATASEEVIKVAFRMLLYSMFFVLLYRSIVAILKSTVERLANWRNRSEAVEDAEFVLIIETMVVMVTILATTLFAVIEEFFQLYIDGRQADVKDVLVSVMAILLSALVVYTIPAVGELEFAIKEKLEKEVRHYKKKQA
jgi:hypothetical protein